MALYKGDVKISGLNAGFTPSNSGEKGQVLTKTENGYEWEDEKEVQAVTQTQYDNLPNTKNSDGVWRIIYE